MLKINDQKKSVGLNIWIIIYLNQRSLPVRRNPYYLQKKQFRKELIKIWATGFDVVKASRLVIYYKGQISSFEYS